jgi:4-amino-4-deoxy-L-arabinose transferase-like glycosyltransferase
MRPEFERLLNPPAFAASQADPPACEGQILLPHAETEPAIPPRAQTGRPARKALAQAIPYLLLVLCSLLYLYPFMRVLRIRTDEGTLLYGAVRVVNGEVPFRDFFEAYVGPGTFYWLALFFKVFGISWFATRVSLILTTTASIVLMYRLSRRLGTGFDLVPGALMLSTSVGLLWPSISHHGDSNLFALFTFSTLLWWIDRPRPVLLLLTGVLAGITTCFLQPKGLLLIVAVLVVVCRLARKIFWSSAGWLAAGYLSVGTAVLWWFWRAGALRDVFDTTVMWPLTRYTGLNAVPYGTGLVTFYWGRWTDSLLAQFPAWIVYPAATFLIVPHVLIACLPLLLAGFAWMDRRRAFTRLTFPYWMIGLALWFSEVHRKDIMHLVYGSPVLVILFFHLAGKSSQGADHDAGTRRLAAGWRAVNALFHKLRSRWMPGALRTITLCTAALAAFNVLVVLTAHTGVATRRGIVQAYAEDPVMEFLNTHTSRGEEVFAYPYGPMYYFLADLKNPTRYSFLLYDQNIDSQFVDAVRQLEAKKVRYVLWDKTLEDESVKWAFPQNWNFRPKGRIIEPYLMEHYELVKDVNGVRILVRK